MMVEDPTAQISVAWGITIGLVASFVQSLGLTIQRKSHVLNQEAPESEQRVEHRRPLWLLGFGIFISSNVLGSVFQIASLPVVILAPLGAVSLLWNALFARLILGELFSRYMVFGTILIVAGAVLIARFGIVPEPTHNLEDLLALFRRDAFIIYFSLLGAAVCFAIVVTHVAEWSIWRRIARESPNYSSPSRSPSPVGIPLTPSNERTPLLSQGKKKVKIAASLSSGETGSTPSTLQKHRSTLNLVAGSYASVSGILSGMCLLFAKSGVELLLLSIFGGQNQFYRWESWALVGGLVVFALLQLWYLHKSLVLADPTLVCPVAFCMYNLSSIVNGLIYYNQLDALTKLNLGLVIFGIVVLLVGVWAVSIQSDEVEVVEGETTRLGVREGDWINADESGVAPAVAPADVVRVIERTAGISTLPKDIKMDTEAHSGCSHSEVASSVEGSTTHIKRAKPKKDLQLNLSRRTQTEPGVSPKQLRTVSSPSRLSTSPTKTVFPSSAEPYDTEFERMTASQPLLSAGRPPSGPTPQRTPRSRGRSLHSPTSPLASLPPGFSIGLSAVSPGFGVPVTRRRGDAGHYPRRSLSLTGDIRWENYGSTGHTEDVHEPVPTETERPRPWGWLRRSMSWLGRRKQPSTAP